MSDQGLKGPSYPVFLVFPQVVQRLGALLTALDPVSEIATKSHLLTVDLYFRSATGTALLALLFDPRILTTDALSDIASLAGRAGGAFVDASRLPERARRRFHEQYLPLYEVGRGGLGSIEEALGALAAEISTPPAGGGQIERVEVRFRRGDTWQLARVRSMTREGVSIATGTPPRRGDVVDLEISACGIVL